MHWQKLTLADAIEKNLPSGVSCRSLTNRRGKLIHFTVNQNALLRELEYGCWLVVPISGIGSTREGRIKMGDLWLGNGLDLEIRSEGNESAEIYALKLMDIEVPEKAQVILGEGRPFEDYPDPNDRPTQPVQVLSEGPVSVLRTRFVPEFCAAEHWHDFDTWYFILSGSMRFGEEGVYVAKDVRQVEGGYSYGPEDPGPEGVDFILVSVGGPIALHWTDLEPSPKGSLTVV